MAKTNQNFISNIDELVAKKLKELNLKPSQSLDKFKKRKKRFYSLPCQTKNNKKIFFKILIDKNKTPALWLKKEALFTEFISNFSKIRKDLNVPLFLDKQIEKKPYWFLHQYLPGPLVGHHFKIYKKGLKKEIRDKIINNLISLQSISCQKNKKILQKIGLPERTIKQYLEKIKKIEKIINQNHQKEIDFKKIYQFFEQRKKYFNENKLVLAHGDFTLANFFINQGNVYLTDWEQAHLDNFASDIARMWIQTFNYPKWRRELVLSFLSKIPVSQRKRFKESFRVISIVEALVEFSCSAKGRKGDKIRKIQKKTCQNSFKGFDCLINS